MTTDGADLNKRRFLTNTTAVIGAVGAGFVAVPFLSSWAPSERAKSAGAPVEADISKLVEGQKLTVEWRGKPVWIIKRTDQNLKDLPTLDSELRDPNSENDQQPVYAQNGTRSIKPKIVVMVGICTHLGCSPSYRPELGSVESSTEWKGGFFCPCHGSRFDLAGRVFSGVPAPLNLPIPPHYYKSERTILIGKDGETS